MQMGISSNYMERIWFFLEGQFLKNRKGRLYNQGLPFESCWLYNLCISDVLFVLKLCRTWLTGLASRKHTIPKRCSLMLQMLYCMCNPDRGLRCCLVLHRTYVYHSQTFDTQDLLHNCCLKWPEKR